MPGEHLGEILRAMKKAADEKVTSVAGEDPAIRAQLGFLWERAVEMVWAGVAWKDALEITWKEYCVEQLQVTASQSRLEMDGVKLTPDGYHEIAGVLSFKLTWKSMKKWEQDPHEYFWSWLMAEQAYARAYSKLFGRPVTTCRFYIFWVNGDYSYKPGRGPQATFCDVEFDPDESERDWQTILRYRAWMRAEKERRKASDEAAAL